MLKTIKRYELSEDVTVEQLESLGFNKFNKDVDGQNVTYYNKCSQLYKDIELFVDIFINEDGTLSFDDCDNVLVIDDNFGQPYTPFYDNKQFQFLSVVIYRYNEFMDKLVEEGILKPMILEEEMKRVLK